MKTRERILITARLLFNDRGYGNVTLAILANELNMTKGNLWYHFNDKRALLDTLSAEFLEQDAARLTIMPDENSVLESYVNFLTELALEIRDFRFMFRGQTDYGEHSQIVLEKLPRIYDQTVEQFIAFFHCMKDAGYLTLDEQRFATLALNGVLVLRYNLEFLRERQLLSSNEPGAVTQTFQQHFSLFEDYLTPEAVTYFNATLLISGDVRKAV